MNNEITIITTLVANNVRKIQIGRFIKYHQRLNCQIIIIVPHDVKIEAKYSKENVKFVSCDPKLAIQDKLVLAASLTNTPYISWVTDDDFLGKDFMKKSIDIMNKHKNIAACDGLTIFSEEETGIRKDYLYSYKNYKNGLKFKEINISRKYLFRFGAKNHNPAAIHGVMRKKVFFEAISFIQRIDSPVNWGDYLFMLILLIHGKVHYIDSIANIRSYGTRILSDKSKYHNNPQIPPGDLILDNETINEVLEYYKKEKGSVNAAVKAEIVFYIIRATNILSNLKERNSLFTKLIEYNNIIGSALKLELMRLTNKDIAEDLNFAKKMLKEYSLLQKD